MALSGIIKLFLREEVFRSLPSQKSLGGSSEVQAVLKNRDLPYTSGGGQARTVGQARTIAIAYNVLGVTSSKEGFSHLILEFYCMIFGSWREHCQSRWEIFI